MKQESLPSGYSIAHLEDGRFYPLRITKLGEYIDLSTMQWTTQRVPFARGPQPTHGTVSFADRKLAEQYCHREHEEFLLLWNAARHGWRQELYPERNAWYREEILRLVREHDPHSSLRDRVEVDDHYDAPYAYVYLNLRGNFQAIRVKGESVDEALQALYHEVFEHIKGPIHGFEQSPERTTYYRDAIEAITGEAPFTFITQPPITDTPGRCNAHPKEQTDAI